MRGKPREKEIKAAAIAALILGDSPTEIANRYNLPRGTVRNWQPDAKKLAEVSRISGGRISDLVEGYVVSGLESLTAQAKQAGNPMAEPANGKGVGDAHRQYVRAHISPFGPLRKVG
jgi:hypothetical protein